MRLLLLLLLPMAILEHLLLLVLNPYDLQDILLFLNSINFNNCIVNYYI